LDIYVAHLVPRRPFNGVFKLQLAPNIHPNTVYQRHGLSPYFPAWFTGFREGGKLPRK
jgi:hypothetical protein